ncbi:MAG TPA: FeoB-associated Cys-rich membrane protein [Chitinophagales bacterium]|nr:FeoB-associated Cys-rich membrane protein [Chitinophagales bacterium]HLP51015.1 FeoB-associated Cys-rich membrane protein [Chitinophagales bacterium]
MEPNLPLIVFGIIAAIALVAFLVYQNLKDKKQLEEEMDKPVSKPHDVEDEERI